MTLPRFLAACRRQPTDTTPIWLMRQAGRYMPEYRAIRAKHSFLEMVRSPEVAAEITLQPVDLLGVDAAILFADILPPLIGMGLELDYLHGEGPVLYNPIRTPADIDALHVPTAEENTPFTLETIRLLRPELDQRGVPLIGFSGAPFTLAAYAIEGGGSKHHARVKALMMGEPAAWDTLMTKLTALVSGYLIAQVEAGAQAVQLFDSWVGQLSPGDFRAHVLPYVQTIVHEVRAKTGVPVIYFGTDTSGFLPDLKSTNADVIGVDWRVDLRAARRILGDDVAVQGNLDPIALFAPWEAVQPRAADVIQQAGGRAGHIFNLGHGILPETPVDTVRRLVDYVHEYAHQPVP